MTPNARVRPHVADAKKCLHAACFGITLTALHKRSNEPESNMTRTEALNLLNSLPRRMTFVNFTFRDFDSQTKHGDARVEHRPDGVFMVGAFGYGKTRDDVRTALKEYLGGRELVSHQHHD